MKSRPISKYDRVMHSLKGPPPGKSWKPKSHVYMRRQMTAREAERVNELYAEIGWTERWKMEGSEKPRKPAKPSREFPEYARLGVGGPALRHTQLYYYYRDAGHWAINVMWRKGKLICSDRKGPMAHAFGEVLVPCTEEEWKKDNDGWLPEGWK